MGKKWNVVNQKEIDLIKALIDANVQKSKICGITKRGYNVIEFIGRSDGTLEDYRRITRAYNKERDERLAQEKEAVQTEQTPEATVAQPVNGDYANTVKVVAQRLEHIEGQIQELNDNYHAMMAILQSKKLIW